MIIKNHGNVKYGKIKRNTFLYYALVDSVLILRIDPCEPFSILKGVSDKKTISNIQYSAFLYNKG
uniref:Uncharacterized protein n=1 Tax=Aliivibrio fischeri TaxID=668 RepID=H2ERQ9_ALIFS|nr:hypothetical protein [Aliivibrio fischeri]